MTESVTESDVTGSDVIFPRFFLTIVVVQNVPLLFVIRFTASDYSLGIFWSLYCLSFDLQLLIIPLVSSSFSCKGTFCTTTIVRKKRGGKMTSLPVITSLSVTCSFVRPHILLTRILANKSHLPSDPKLGLYNSLRLFPP